MTLHRLTPVRCLVALAGMAVCFTLIATVSRAGYASYLVSGLPEQYASSSVGSALRLNPSDPEVHLARAKLLWRDGQRSEAIKEFETVVKLRPAHFLAWSHLGVAREQLGDRTGAVVAFSEAVRLAPHYAQPRLRYGKALLNIGRANEGFRELYLAMKSDPALAEQVRAFVWDEVAKDANRFRQAIQPDSDESRLGLAAFLIKQGAVAEGAEILREVEQVPEVPRREMIAEMLKANRFAEAHEVWASASKIAGQQGVASLINGGFEDKMVMDQMGFDWQALHSYEGIKFSVDMDNPQEGQFSLRIDLGDTFDVRTKIISQLVLIKPNTRYSVEFAFRSGKLVSGGLPVLVVKDANSLNVEAFAQSDSLTENTLRWQKRKLDFMTGRGTQAIQISLERQECSTTPCPIFGTLWLDGFSLEEVSSAVSSRKQSAQSGG